MPSGTRVVSRPPAGSDFQLAGKDGGGIVDASVDATDTGMVGSAGEWYRSRSRRFPSSASMTKALRSALASISMNACERAREPQSNGESERT
jgi:hypothetical protein